jgi:hypothetical protein
MDEMLVGYERGFNALEDQLRWLFSRRAIAEVVFAEEVVRSLEDEPDD